MLLESYGEKPKTILIATHLIEEIAHVIEHIVIIKRGEILRDEPVETLLESGYTVTGAAAVVDQFLQGRHPIGCDTLGGLKTAYFFRVSGQISFRMGWKSRGSIFKSCLSSSRTHKGGFYR